MIKYKDITLVILIMLLQVACKSQKAKISHGITTDTVDTKELHLIDKKDVKGIDLPMGRCVTIQSIDGSGAVDISLTRISDKQYLVEQKVKKVKINQTAYIPTRIIDKSKKISKTKTITKTSDNDKTKTVTKTPFPFWIWIVLLASAGIVVIRIISKKI